MIPRAIFAAIAFAATTGGTAAMDRAAMKAYVASLVAASVASDRCGGMDMDKSRLTVARAMARIADHEEPQVDAEILRMKPIIEQAFAKVGAAEWCASAWDLLGPSGTGAIRRR